jgi:hypothetical protein
VVTGIVTVTPLYYCHLIVEEPSCLAPPLLSSTKREFWTLIRPAAMGCTWGTGQVRTEEFFWVSIMYCYFERFQIWMAVRLCLPDTLRCVALKLSPVRVRAVASLINCWGHKWGRRHLTHGGSGKWFARCTLWHSLLEASSARRLNGHWDQMWSQVGYRK